MKHVHVECGSGFEHARVETSFKYVKLSTCISFNKGVASSNLLYMGIPCLSHIFLIVKMLKLNSESE